MNNKLNPLLSRGIRLIVVVFLMVVTFSYAMFQGGFVSWFLFYSLIPFLIYSFLLNFAPIRISQVKREVKPVILQRGDTAQVTVSFQNRSWFPLLFMTVQEVDVEHSIFEKSKGQVNNIFFVGWKRNFQWTYDIEDLNRGEITFPSLLFTFTDFFGWTIRKKNVNEQQKILVFPKITELTYKPLQLYSQGGSLSPFSLQKDSSNVTSVRDYQAGDRVSWIHWKSFAKNSTLRTKEFEENKTHEVFLTIDRTTEKYFEESVELAASILRSIVNNRGNISFISLGQDCLFYPNIKTAVQLEHVMNHLAIVKPDATEGLDVLLSKEMNYIRSATLVVITGEINEQLKRLFANSGQFGQSIICLLLVESEDVEHIKRVKIHEPNVKVVPISRKQFRNVFTEVMKP